MHTFQIWKVDLLRLNLYFYGTQAYIIVARSFAAFGGSCSIYYVLLLISCRSYKGWLGWVKQCHYIDTISTVIMNLILFPAQNFQKFDSLTI
jgi:hypothetical protein